MARHLQTAPDSLGGTPTTWLSKQLWDSFPSEGIASGRYKGYFKVYDFREGDVVTDGVTGWVSTAYDAGTDGGEVVAIQDAHGGTLLITPNDADNDGQQLQHGGGEWIDLDSVSDFRMEIRCKIADVSAAQFLAGLSETDTSIFAAGVNSSANYLGIQEIETGILTGIAEKAGTPSGGSSTTLTSVTAATLTDDTFFKAGFHVKNAPGGRTVDFYVNGLLAGSAQDTYIPVVEMRPTVAYAKAGTGTTANNFTVDWIAIGVLDS